MNELEDHFRAGPLEQRVVRFGAVPVAKVIALLEHLLGLYRLYRAAAAGGRDLFVEGTAGDFSFLAEVSPAEFWVDFYAESPPLFRPCFRLIRTGEGILEVFLVFDLFDMPDPPPVASLLERLRAIATILGSPRWEIHHEVNDQWRVGDFSDATLIYVSDCSLGRGA